MICEICGKREAQVELQKSTLNEKTSHFLCIDCARDKGIEKVKGQLQFNLGKILNALEAEPSGLDKCPGCHKDLESIKKSKEAGCSLCYLFFREEIGNLLKKDNPGELKYKGSFKSGTNNKVELEKRLKLLIREERYEEAAEVRDQLRELS